MSNRLMEQSVEEIVRTSDERAVRLAFDERNLGWFRAMLMMSIAYFGIATLLLLARGRGIRSLIPLVNFATSISLIVALGDKRRDRRIPQFIRAHLPGVIIASMALQNLCGLLVAPRSPDAAIPWTAMFPWFMTGFRFATIELTLLHGSLAAISVINASQLPRESAAMTAMGIFMNFLPFLAGAFASRRRKRDVLSVWQERRRHAGEVVRMRDELRYAREIQLSMLPEAPPPLDWVDVAGVSIPATEVGGDYYDYFVVGDRLAIVSGDVAGHGLASGIVLATLRSGFTLLRHALTDPADVLRQLHDLVAVTSRRRTLVTCAVVLLDRQRRRATIASAGHPPVIVRRNRAVESVELFAPPLGVRLQFEIPRREIAFEQGDAFVLHTDGVYEATNALGESYGLDRLVEVVAKSANAGARELRDAIVSDVERFRGGDQQRDDVTIVVATIGAC